jgi:GAF domain-containing protein
MGQSIRGRLIPVFIGLAIGPLLVVGIIMAWLSYISLQQQALALQQETAMRVTSQVTAFFQELEKELRFTIQTQGLSTPDQDHSGALSNLLAFQPAFEELHLLNGKGQEQTAVYRASGSSTGPVDRSEADEFVLPLTTGEAYYGPVRFDPSTHEPLMILSIPVVNSRTDTVDGVLVSVIRITPMWDLLAGIQLRQGQSIYILDAQGKVVAHRNPSVVLQGTNVPIPKQNGVQPGLDGKSVALAVTPMNLGRQQLNVIAEQSLTEVMAPVINLVIVMLILIVVMAGIAGTLGRLSVRPIVQPIQALTETAGAIGAGDLTSRALITSDDEIGILAGTFNSMARQLRDRIGTLEERVGNLTKALATFSAVSRLSTILDEKRLAAEVVEQIKNAFNYNHAQIFFYDRAGENLIIAGGTGEVGQILLADGYKIPKGKGPVGHAAESNTPVLMGDISQDPNWLPNPLLPKTRSEVAVPVAVGDQVLGVLDMQQNIVNGITQADADLLQTIANQVAIMVRHARSYTQIQEDLEREALIASISHKIRETTTAENALQVAVRELGRALGSKETRVVLSASPQSGQADAEPRPGDGK